jgi:hypothetical protein
MPLKDAKQAFLDFRRDVSNHASEMDFGDIERHRLLSAVDRFARGDLNLDNDTLFDLWDALGMDHSRSADLEVLFGVLATLKELRDSN